MEDTFNATVMVEDARRFADFKRSREGVPWNEIKAWMSSSGTPDELPPAKPRKLLCILGGYFGARPSQ
jgi:hypothetical protein